MRLFEDIRWTKKISIFPVGLIGYQAVTSPIVIKNPSKKSVDEKSLADPASNTSQQQSSCQVIGFSDPWFANRKFPIDMAGFAANVDFLSSHPPTLKRSTTRSHAHNRSGQKFRLQRRHFNPSNRFNYYNNNSNCLHLKTYMCRFQMEK